jgi:beta-glucosidase
MTDLLELGVLTTDAEARGVASAADWARWEQRGRVPPSGRGFGLGEAPAAWFTAFAAELGARSVVLTLEWARLQPEPGRYDPASVEDQLAALQAARDAGLSPWGCLIDQTLPGWFADDLGGLLDDSGRRLLWPRHVDWVGETFGDLVDGWVTQREPVRRALRGWEWGVAPPGRRDPRRAAEAVQAAVLADGEAWRLLRGAGRPVACLHTARSVEPADDGPEARSRARRLDALWWGTWTGALRDGQVEVPGLAPVAAPELRDAFDVVGLQLRSAQGIGAEGSPSPHPPQRRPGPSGGVAWAEGVGLALRRAGEEVPARELVVVTDVADAVADGRNQADHLAAVVDEVLAARHDGLSVTRWWQSSPVDGYGWERGLVAGGVLDPEGRPKVAAEGLARLRA